MPKTNLAGATTDVLQETISAYTYEAYTNAKKLSSTAIVGGNSMIDKNTETFVGQLRWFKPLNPTINVASLTDATDGTKSSYSTDYLQYIKTVRTHGYEKVNMKQIVTQHDGLQRMGRDFAETRAQDEHNAIAAVLKSVMLLLVALALAVRASTMILRIRSMASMSILALLRTLWMLLRLFRVLLVQRASSALSVWPIRIMSLRLLTSLPLRRRWRRCVRRTLLTRTA
jgi:hypothetical protein